MHVHSTVTCTEKYTACMYQVMNELFRRDGALCGTSFRTPTLVHIPGTEYIQYVCTRCQVLSPHGTKTTCTNIENLLFGALVHYLVVLLVCGKPAQKWHTLPKKKNSCCNYRVFTSQIFAHFFGKKN